MDFKPFALSLAALALVGCVTNSSELNSFEKKAANSYSYLINLADNELCELKEGGEVSSMQAIQIDGILKIRGVTDCSTYVEDEIADDDEELSEEELEEVWEYVRTASEEKLSELFIKLNGDELCWYYADERGSKSLDEAIAYELARREIVCVDENDNEISHIEPELAFPAVGLKSIDAELLLRGSDSEIDDLFLTTLAEPDDFTGITRADGSSQCG